MHRKRIRMIALCFVIIGVVVFLFIYCRSISGRDLFDYIQLDNIERITVQKVVENDTLPYDFGSFLLTQSEIDSFFEVISDSQLKDIGLNSFAINTEVRYFAYFCNSEGYAEGTMKFYGDKTLIFDYVYGDRPAIHKIYSIVSSSFEDFFESIILLNTEG